VWVAIHGTGARPSNRKDDDPHVVIAVTADVSARALLALQTPTDSVLMLFPDQATAVRAIGVVGAGMAGRDEADAAPSGVSANVREAVTIVDVGDHRGDPGLHIDTLRDQVSWNGAPLPLTRLERGVLGRLAARPVQVWPYERLHQAVWGTAWLGDSSTLHAVVKRLRRKLRDADVTTAIESVRGVGFRLTR
jgi:two-component system, OmpR family, response regulator MtrA